jgi:hypothetical protein
LLLTPAEFFDAKGPVLADDEIRLPSASGVDDVELAAPCQGSAGGAIVGIEALAPDRLDEGRERSRVWIDDDVEVLVVRGVP